MSDSHPVMVGPKGRVVIPVDIRRDLGLKEGSELMAFVEDEAVILLTREAAKRRLRAMFSGATMSLADELIAERRLAAREEARP